MASVHIQVGCVKLLHTANLSCSLATDAHGIVHIVKKDVLRMVQLLFKVS